MYGNMNGLLIALFVAIVLDYITGLLRAGINKELSSAIGFKGILKKMLILIVIALAHVIDNCVGSGETWRNIAIVFYICNEGLSILENIVACGVPIPEKIKDALEAMQNNDEKEGDQNGNCDNI
jgi:toxin secretion/phage lysis holin